MRMDGHSHVGYVRARNEDTIAWDERLGIALVADGMGGHPAGNVASHTAVDCVLAAVRGERRDASALVANGDAGRYIELAHHALMSHGRHHPETQGMGTTLVLLALAPPHGVVAHVGDSRAYRLRGGWLERLTSDDNAAQRALDQGLITPDQARRSPERHQLVQALGIGSPEPHVTPIEVGDDDVFLLCTDGLNGELPDREIQELMNDGIDDLSSTARALVRGALDRGGHDNVSVVLARA